MTTLKITGTKSVQSNIIINFTEATHCPIILIISVVKESAEQPHPLLSECISQLGDVSVSQMFTFSSRHQQSRVCHP